MDNETLRKVQLAQLEIAKEIRRICDENGIGYFLDAGTLLGAVRHRGFIPWDDDMDFAMLRADYEKFLSIAPSKLREEFFLQTWDTDAAFCYPFAKVRKKGTRYVEAISPDVAPHQELFVDIFPYDEFPSHIREQKRARRQLLKHHYTMFMKCRMRPWKRHPSAVKKVLVVCKYIPYMVRAALKDRETIKEKMIVQMHKYDGSNSGVVCGEYGPSCGKHPMPLAFLVPYKEIPFEGELFKGPANCDGYLKEVYGDYMKLPPENKRGNWHQVIEIKL